MEKKRLAIYFSFFIEWLIDGFICLGLFICDLPYVFWGWVIICWSCKWNDNIINFNKKNHKEIYDNIKMSDLLV